MSNRERPRRNLRRLAASAVMVAVALVAGHLVSSGSHSTPVAMRRSCAAP